MSFESELINNYDCRHVVVARWNQADTTGAVPSARAVVTFIQTVGYSLGNQQRIGFSPTPKDPNQFLILPMNSEAEAKRICSDSVTKGFGINSTQITMHPLIGVNGIRLRDGNDFMKTAQDQFENSEMLDLLMITIRLELPERLEVIERGYAMIKNAISELVENASCEMFGSFASKVRRNGYSDIDINVDSSSIPGQANSMRSLQMLIANPKLLIEFPLTREELHSYPQEEIIKILFHCFNENKRIRKSFEVRFVPARTPILVFKIIDPTGINVSYDVSVCNQKGVDKASLLDEFIMKDKSHENKMKNSMLFIVHWARTNKLLSGVYPEEKLEIKTNLNSYIFNQLIIHFVQAAANKILVHPQAKYGSRVDEYDFDQLFTDHCKFLREFYKYYASFDFNNKAIYGKQAMQKSTLSKVHGAKESPLMMMDPMDVTHNISANVTEIAVKRLNGLIRNTLYILKQRKYHINCLLETNQTAVAMMKERHTSINIDTRMSEGVQKHYMSVQLHNVVRTADDLLLLLTRVLRFDISPDFEGPSVTDLQSTGGVIFSVQAKTWIGRRNKKRQLKTERPDLTPLQLDVMCSDLYQYEDEPIALIRVAMPTTSSTPFKRAYVEMLHGDTFEVRAAFHYLMDQFVYNNMDVLLESGIQSISNIPSLETTSSS
uniref:PAP-associated domain-containing protein n=1 Tax=Caenorhabditis tropicalis TaxID=1561998 RepID=A0A1I7TP55_9PELO